MSRCHRRIALFCCCLLALELSAGCAKPPPAGKEDPLPVEDYPRNVVVEGLHRAVVFGDSIVTEGDGQGRPLHVVQPIRSLEKRTLHVQFKFDFLDAQGRPLRGQSGWRFRTLVPRIETPLESTAMDTNAVDWRLTVRPAK